MTYLRLEQIELGMITASDVCDRRGKLLIQKEISLTQKHLRTLKAWGVSEVAVTRQMPSLKSEPAKCIDPKIESKINQLFVLNDIQCPAVIELKNLLTSRYTARKTR